MASRPVERKALNQAVFSKLYVVEDEIAGADLTPGFRRLLADDLRGAVAAEEARELIGQSQTRDLWDTRMADQEATEIGTGARRDGHARTTPWPP